MINMFITLYVKEIKQYIMLIINLKKVNKLSKLLIGQEDLTICNNILVLSTFFALLYFLNIIVGQHLISAIFENELKLNTVSWWLGEEVSYIELGLCLIVNGNYNFHYIIVDTPTLTQNQINDMEDRLNMLIREGRNVNVQIIDDKSEMNEAHTRGLPEDHVGDIRVVVIDGIDNNMCCGTHVTNLAQLQVIKLLNVEKSKRKNKCLLNFLVGNRVLKRLQTTLEREQDLVKVLK